MLHRFLIVALLLSWPSATLQSAAAADSPAPESATDERPLDRYAARAEPDYGWTIEHRDDSNGHERIDLTLRSQRWQGMLWQHDVRIFRPDNLAYPRHAVVFVNGGSNLRKPGRDINLICASLASLCQMPVIAIFQVPNQPLLGGRYEDDLVAETWVNYLRTGQETWPLLFPMVKSAIAAMNCADEVSRQEWDQPLENFVITGASKRGWTSWLTAAADKRVVGTAPMVFDTLNLRKQMREQHSTWGFFSEQIADYTRRGLVSLDLETPQEEKLRLMMDPYSYRQRLTVPKLLINGTNDRYWLVDAQEHYWGELSAPKNILMIPNAGHGLEGGHMRIFQTFSQFTRRIASDQRLPDIRWEVATDRDQRRCAFTVSSDTPATQITCWTALAPTRDFREAEWVESDDDLDSDPNRAKFEVDVPPDRHVAIFANIKFGHALFRFDLSTGVVQPEFATAEPAAGD